MSTKDEEENHAHEEHVHPTDSEDTAASDATDSSAIIEKLEEDLKKAQEDVLRAKAETENIKRRAQDEVRRAHKFAVESFAENLLTVNDSLKRALTIETSDLDALKTGLEMTLKQFESVFDKFQITAVRPEEGEALDPEKHQAMSTQSSDTVAANHILNVIQEGYLIADRLLRPALVIVSSGKS